MMQVLFTFLFHNRVSTHNSSQCCVYNEVHSLSPRSGWTATNLNTNICSIKATVFKINKQTSRRAWQKGRCFCVLYLNLAVKIKVNIHSFQYLSKAIYFLDKKRAVFAIQWAIATALTTKVWNEKALYSSYCILI